MKFGLAYEMQRPTLDDHAVVEETIGHADVMKSIELFGKHVIPAFR